MIPFLLCAARLDQPNTSYAGTPKLASANKYRILSENVAINLVSENRVRIASTTVYRNIGDATTATLSISDGLLGPKGAASKIIATWDDVPIVFDIHTGPAQESTATATVALGKEATHALRMNVYGVLAKAGYAKDQLEFRYRLAGDHPIELFSLAYRYPSGSIFGLPTVEPDLGWEIGSKGASIRKTDFTPSDQETKIQFYRNAMDLLGTKG